MKLPSRVPAAALLVAVAGPCVAETTPYYVGGVVSYAYNSNVLGMYDGQTLDTPPVGTPPGTPPENIKTLRSLGYTSKADHITSLALIGGLDQQIGRQRIFGDVTLRKNDYASNGLLDNDSYALTAGADLQTAERVSGNVLLKSSRDQITYGVFERPTGEQVSVTANSADFSLRVGGTTRLTFDAAAGWRSLDYSSATYDPRDYKQTSVSFGGRYWPSANSSAGLGVRAAKGRYPKFAPGEEETFDRRDIDLSASWQASGVTNLSARASYTDVDYKLQNNQDFRGWTGFLRASWQPTAKIQLGADLARDRGQDLRFQLDPFTQVDSPQVVSAVRLRGSYAATAKVALNANALYSRRPVTVTDPFFGTSESGRETVRQFAIGAAWTPTRTSRVGCDYSVERRRSDVVLELNTSVDVVSCYAQLTLQP